MPTVMCKNPDCDNVITVKGENVIFCSPECKNAPDRGHEFPSVLGWGPDNVQLHSVTSDKIGLYVGRNFSRTRTVQGWHAAILSDTANKWGKKYIAHKFGPYETANQAWSEAQSFIKAQEVQSAFDKTHGVQTLRDTVVALVDEVHHERCRQVELWPNCEHLPDGTGGAGRGTYEVIAKNACNRAHREDRLTHAHVFEEEAMEVLNATEAKDLREELIQVMAVCAKWVADIDSRVVDEKLEAFADETPGDTAAAESILSIGRKRGVKVVVPKEDNGVSPFIQDCLDLAQRINELANFNLPVGPVIEEFIKKHREEVYGR